jgi:type III secretion protein L
MVFIARGGPDLSRPDLSRKIIKARDFWAYSDARRAVDEALARKEEILRSAQEAYRAERERGYTEGNESARLEQSGSMIEIVNRTAEYYGRVESEMVDLVLEAVRKVVSEFDDRERVSTAVRNCLDLVRSQKNLRLSAHPSQVEFLREHIGELRRDYPNIAHIEVHPDAKLAADACMVESDIGIVEASLHGQVQALRETLSTVFAAKDDEAQEQDADAR